MRHVTVELRWWGELLAVEEVEVGARPRRVERVDGVPLLAPIVLADRDGVAIERPGEAAPFTHVRVRASEPERHPGFVPLALDGWLVPMLVAFSIHALLLGVAFGGARQPWADAHAILDLALPARPAAPRRTAVVLGDPTGAPTSLPGAPPAPGSTEAPAHGAAARRGATATGSGHRVLDVLAAVDWHAPPLGASDLLADALADVVAERTPGWGMGLGIGVAGSGAGADGVGVTLATGVAASGLGRELPELAPRDEAVPGAIGMTCDRGGRCAHISTCVCCFGCGAIVTGPLPREVVRRTLARQRNALRSCVEAHGAVGTSGRVDVHFVIAPDGSTHVVSSTSAERSVMATCMARALERTVFPTAEAPTGVHYPITFALE